MKFIERTSFDKNLVYTSNINMLIWVILFLFLILILILMKIKYYMSEKKSKTSDNQLFETILDNTLESIVVINSNGNFIFLNKASLDLLEYDEVDLLGKSISKIMPDEIGSKHNSFIKRYLDTGETSVIGFCREVECRKKNNTCFPAELSVSEYKHEDEHYFIGVIKNINERKKQEESIYKALSIAEDATKAKGMFLANISHELRTPLNSVIGMSEVLKETQLDEEQEKYINSILKSGKNLLGLINDILDISKIEANELLLEKISVNIEKVIEDVVDVLSLKAYSKNIDLHYYVDQKITHTYLTDPMRLTQILINLTNNAIKFTEEGEVVIWVKQLNDNTGEILFEIEDTGIGVTEEQQLKIFNSFSQADEKTTRNYGGTGLGLSISSSLVELMNGKIGVTSNVDLGSKFYFSLPLQMDTEVVCKKIENNYKYLFVVDSESICHILKQFIANNSLKGSVESVQKLKELIAEGLLGKDLVFVIILKEQFDLDLKTFDFLINSGISPKKIVLGVRINGKNHRKILAKKRGVLKIIDLPLLRDSFFEQLKEVVDLEISSNKAKCKNLAIIDDNLSMLEVLKMTFTHPEIKVFTFSNPFEAIESFRKRKYDLVISDYYMPDLNGDKVYEEFKLDCLKSSTFILITGDITGVPREIIREIIILDKPLNMAQLEHLVFDSLSVKQISLTPKILDDVFDDEVKPKVLVVDDSEENRVLMQAYLSKQDFDVDYAENGVLALELLKVKDYDIIFMDMHMPIMDGFDCVLAARNELKIDTTIVALTANVLQNEKDRAVECGCNEYLTKPVAKNDIVSLVVLSTMDK